jgi:hypothetical protein
VVLLGVLPTPMLDSILRPVQALRTPVAATTAAAAPGKITVNPSTPVATTANADPIR